MLLELLNADRDVFINVISNLEKSDLSSLCKTSLTCVLIFVWNSFCISVCILLFVLYIFPFCQLIFRLHEYVGDNIGSTY